MHRRSPDASQIPAHSTHSARLEWMPLGQLQAARRNPKQHSSDIGTSIGRFGYVEPIVLDERTGRIVAGHGRREALMAMRARGEVPPAGIRAEGDEWLVPVLRGWASRSDAEAEAYLLASNKLTEVGGWDNAMLAELLKDLGEQDALDGVGFTDDEIAALLGQVEGMGGGAAGGGTEGLTDPDEVPEEPAEAEVYVKPGELWMLGKHQLLCGDATRAADVARVMSGAKAQICWTDPPWNVAYGSANGASKHQRIANDNLGDKASESAANPHDPKEEARCEPRLFHRQLADSAWGITVATPQQASIALEFRVKRILLGNQLAAPGAVAWL